MAVKGENSILYVWDGTAYLPIACVTTSQFQTSLEQIDGTVTKCDLNPESRAGKFTYSWSFDGELSNDATKASYNFLLKKQQAKAVIYWKEIETTETSTSKTQFGKGMLTSLSKSANANEMITFSGQIDGSKLSETDLLPLHNPPIGTSGTPKP